MELKEIDNLFGERLKHNAPTPPAALWDRLQERIETEMPEQQQAEKPAIKRWTKSYYSIAAAITVLLATGIIFFNLSNELPAKHHTTTKAEASNKEVPAPVQTPATSGTALAATPEGDTQEINIPANTAAPATKPSAPARPLAKATPKTSESKKAPEAPVEIGKHAPAQTLATITPTIGTATPDAGELPPLAVTPAAVFASAASVEPAQPVEIIIIRSSSEQAVAATGTEQEEEELSGFEKKQRLAKGIIRQARNLTNGERVELSDIGINASRIALETQIGKHKFAKVFNL